VKEKLVRVFLVTALLLDLSALYFEFCAFFVEIFASFQLLVLPFRGGLSSTQIR